MNSIIQYRQLIEETLIANKYGTHPKELYEPIEYFMSLGGKRMRPVLTLLGCEMFGKEAPLALPAAMAVEIFHNFTLVHDDIMDNAPLRRNKPTVHEKWNTNIAILSGDVMLVKAYQELCSYDTNRLPALLNIFNETAIKVCEGQQLDMNFETVTNVSILQYIKMIELKTAVLLGCALKMGAIVAGANEKDADAIYEFGQNIGIAFQLQDDILDVYGDADKFGKQKGGDIVANKKTFLLLKAIEMANGNAYKKEELHQWIHAPEFNPVDKVEAITAIYDFFDIKKLARLEMKKYYNRALDKLNQLSVGDSQKGILKGFADSLMEREC